MLFLFQGVTASALAVPPAVPGLGIALRGSEAPSLDHGPHRPPGGRSARRSAYGLDYLEARVSRLVSVSAVVGAVCGIGALLLGFVGLPIRIAPPVLAERLYTQVSLHLFFMEMILVIAALFVGVLGFVGYQSLKNEARTAAERVAGKAARRQLRALRATERPFSGEPTDEEDAGARKESVP